MLWSAESSTPAPEESPERLAARCYDLFYGARPDVPFFLRLARELGGPVLELGCGTGRVLLPVARETGLTVVGVDRDGEALDVLLGKLESEEPAVRDAVGVVDCDFRDLALDDRFALVMFPFRSFQELLTPEDRLAALLTARRHLRDDGVLVVDNYNPDVRQLADGVGELPPMSAPRVLAGGRVVRRADRVVQRDLLRQTQEFEMVFEVEHPDGSTQRVGVRYTTSYQFRYELEHLLALAGFDVEQVYGDYEGGPFGATYPGELIVRARPREGG